MTVLSGSTVAFGHYDGSGYWSAIGVWDWKVGKQLHTLGGFGRTVTGIARLPDGRLVGVSGTTIRIGHPDNWSAATTLSNDAELLGVCSGRDGSFVTADRNGKVKLWRDGSSRALSMSCGVRSPYRPLSIVGSRLVSVSGSNICVLE